MTRLRTILLATGLAMATLSAPVARAGEPIVLVQDVGALSALEARGFGLGAALGRPGLATTRELARGSAVMRLVADTVAADVAGLRADLAAAGHAVDNRRPGEAPVVLDPGWLDSAVASFRLAGVVNRLDQRDVAASEGRATCGEVRLVYRLSYHVAARDGRAVASRLPFTANLVYDVAPGPGGDCLEAALAWVPPIEPGDADAQARFLAGGPLAPERLRLRQLEINGQAARVPSQLEPGFGGQAVYLLRVFRVEREGAAMGARIGTLANTPDVARIRADETLRRDLVAYLRGNVDAIDEGVHALPERFQATRALSYSTFGSARLGNRPFAEILTSEDLAGLDLGRLRLARTPQALVERLDNGTCQGCHQAGSTAGFHLLGLDRADASRHNRLALGVSPHMQAEVARRASYVAALARGAEPSRFRPLSLAPAADWSGPRPAYRPAGTGAACLGEQARALVGEGWDCGREETCEMVARNPRLGVEYGQCMPKREVTGIACQSGRVATGATPTADRMVLLRRFNSTAERASPTAYTCRPPRIGVPGGLAYRQCSDADRAFTAFQRAGDGPMPAEICALAGGRTFDRCVASGDAPSCLADSVQRGMRPACGRDRGCREDFVCQALPDDLPHRERAGEGVGYCSPTYFVFQMRLDGHPAP